MYVANVKQYNFIFYYRSCKSIQDIKANLFSQNSYCLNYETAVITRVEWHIRLAKYRNINLLQVSSLKQ